MQTKVKVITYSWRHAETFVPWHNYVVISLDHKATIVLLQRINSARFWNYRSQYSSVIWTQISWAVCHSGTDIYIQCSVGEQFYVSSPWLLGAPHLPWAKTNLFLCGFPFSPVRDPHHWGCSRWGGLFFSTSAATLRQDLFISSTQM